MRAHPVNPRCKVVIPIKGLRSGKSRLSGHLDDRQRAALTRWLTARTLECVRELIKSEFIYLLSPDTDVLALGNEIGVRTFRQQSVGLNEGLQEICIDMPPDRTLILPVDLPLSAER